MRDTFLASKQSLGRSRLWGIEKNTPLVGTRLVASWSRGEFGEPAQTGKLTEGFHQETNHSTASRILAVYTTVYSHQPHN